MIIRVLFEPRDLWIGVYWDDYYEMGYRYLNLYVCIIPILPILFNFRIGGPYYG